MTLRALTGLAAVAIGLAGLGEASAQYYPAPPGAYGGAYTPSNSPYSGSYLPRRGAPAPEEEATAAPPGAPQSYGSRPQYEDPRFGGGAIQTQPLPDPRYGASAPTQAAPSQAAPPYPGAPVTSAYPASPSYGTPQGYGAPQGYPAAEPAQRPAGPRSWEEQQAMRPPADIGRSSIGAPAPILAPETAQPAPTAAAPAAAAPGTAPAGIAALPPEDQPETGTPKELPPNLRRQLVDFRTKEPAGTIVIDTAHTYLYLVLGGGKAMRYGIGVGREGFTWSGTERISRMAEWPDWHPPKEMIERQPYLPRFMAGGPGNPLGARALYLGKTLYRIHGTNQPSTIGSYVSSGCIRLLNEDIEDLYGRVQVGTRVVVLPGSPPPTAGNGAPATASAATTATAR